MFIYKYVKVFHRNFYLIGELIYIYIPGQSKPKLLDYRLYD
jgi:hypothetical protein